MQIDYDPQKLITPKDISRWLIANMERLNMSYERLSVNLSEIGMEMDIYELKHCIDTGEFDASVLLALLNAMGDKELVFNRS